MKNYSRKEYEKCNNGNKYANNWLPPLARALEVPLKQKLTIAKFILTITFA